MLSKNLLCYSFLFVIFSFQLQAQGNINVPEDYATIQAALNNAPHGTTILVGPGIYNENIVWPNTLTSIKLRSSHGRNQTIIDGGGAGSVLTIESAFPGNAIDETTVIDGFTIRNGIAEQGGGIYAFRSSPTLRNLILEDNVANGKWAYGGGAILDDAVDVEISNCIFRNNLCISDSWAMGGGLHLSAESSIVDGCIFENNEVDGGGWSYGAGLYLSNVFLNETLNSTVSRSKFIGNNSSGTRPYGSGIHSSRIEGLIIANCVFTQNKTSNHSWTGSTIYLYNEEAPTSILHCTLYNNEGGIEFNSDLNCHNSIIRNNAYTFMPSWSDPLWNISSNILDIDLENNINEDPLFFREDILVPIEGSPCLNAGNPMFSLVNDYKGNPRPMPVGSKPDIGAYEIDQYFSHVQTKFYFDENINGVKDAGESYISIGAVSIYDFIEFNKSRDGIFSSVQEGEAVVKYNGSYSSVWALSSEPDAYTFEVEGTNFSKQIEFGITPTRDIDDIKTTIFLPPLRCSREVKIDVYAINEGTNRKTGMLWLELDDRVSEIMPVMPAELDGEFKLGWHFESLLPGDVFKRSVYLKVPGVEDIELGDRLKFKSEVIANDDCQDEFCIDEEVRCSFDPNDKRAFPQREDNLSLLDKAITYIVRFQNVGNDIADDVLVIDTLDSNLDLSTFKLIDSSHPDQLRFSVHEDHILHFDFPQIYLPDSLSDLEGSNGFIMYSIKPVEDLPINTEIKNTAHIYFDFNPAVVTNTTENTLVDMFPTNVEDESEIRISAFPNPSNGIFRLSSLIANAELYNAQGKQIKAYVNTDIIDLADKQAGVYYLRVYKDQNIEVISLVLTK